MRILSPYIRSKKCLDNFSHHKLFVTPAYEELVSRLKYTAEKRLFAIITGEVGSGKSTALRKLLELLNPNKYKVIYISDSALTPRHFYWESLRQLGCEPKFNRGQAKRQLHQVILDSYNPLSLILVGQPELKRVLQRKVMKP